MRPPLLSAARRYFCSSTRLSQTYVSNIGKQPIPLPPGVTLTPTPSALGIEGPLGRTSVPLAPFIRLTLPAAAAAGEAAGGGNAPQVQVAVEDPSVKQQRAMWGTTRTLIRNAVVGMTDGYAVPLYLVGVGFRAVLEDDPRAAASGAGAGGGRRLNMKLGFSHSVFVPVPPHIKAEVPSPTKIVISCTDKQKLGLFAAQVRSFRKPEPYKGKVRRDVIFHMLSDGVLIGCPHFCLLGDLCWE
jgi:large subunit ribosomal protein L6